LPAKSRPVKKGGKGGTELQRIKVGAKHKGERKLMAKENKKDTEYQT